MPLSFQERQEIYNRRIAVAAHPGKKWNPISYLKNNQSKIRWTCGSSGRTPAYQAQGPEFKVLYHQKKFFSLQLFQMSMA
jgi:hypothetical protein